MFESLFILFSLLFRKSSEIDRIKQNHAGLVDYETAFRVGSDVLRRRDVAHPICSVLSSKQKMGNKICGRRGWRLRSPTATTKSKKS